MPSTRRSFGAEHDYFALSFARVRAAAARGEPSAGMTMGRLARRLRRHMRVEEAYLIVPVEGRLDAATRLSMELIRRDHERIDELIATASEALSVGGGAGIAELDALQASLLQHEALEERVLFPLCDDFLTPEQRVLAVRELDRKISGPPSMPGCRS